MLPQERYTRLITYLQEHEIIKIDQLMKLFDISIETARRDLNHLEKEGVIKKIYGGATLVKKEAKEPATSDRMTRNLSEKTAIGKKCAEFISDGDSVLIEVGTTTLQVAKALKEKKNLMVITNSIHVVNELMDTDFDLYVIGGKVRHGEGSVSGAVSMFELENFHIGKAIISAGGVTLERGLSDYNIEEALIRKKVVEQSRETILVADNSKFGRDVLAHVCPISAMDLVITGEGLSPEMITRFEDANVNLVLADGSAGHQ
ncbi:DeoR/GlpR family DNA-binding transcription regulator [Anaerovorax odorimutans]|uniref:DeoR/GlpR family DNA-binding transcription regulator n=1 Tax=Anaerovorax odorimutans TaxID=109327 RepID=A0ABT1RNV7_9FIRM|nr:DeoR/GlpR family DNA-binding transcription regulator [Anaerovorax odorimutans]MCQ4636877.1 DeoR/GlpR family DNA-binding transcription regulator [Anaerovorax odorimutans]